MQVADKMIDMYEDCLDGNYESIENLMQSQPPRVAHSHVSQVVSDDEEEEDDDDDAKNARDAMRNDGSSDMMVDAIEYQSNSTSQPKRVYQPNPEATAEAEDGWVQVTSRRNRGNRN
ncbi:uncharacterized protein LOC111008694 [Momordica charantia]|uniref:Uncharacterized protein LOC111008694 n=1 Tax=Momordica charantia TaxID=3673 RepID=A0A6J1C9I6_MOMCH|nr:uncharacterized protein LOC111008694 [Momordica charantia]